MSKLWFAALVVFAVPAYAEEPAPGDCAALEGDAKTQCESAKAAAEKAIADAKQALADLGDCTALEGDAKAACDAKKAELEAVANPAAPATDASKGGKASRGNTNRMETKFEDD